MYVCPFIRLCNIEMSFSFQLIHIYPFIHCGLMEFNPTEFPKYNQSEILTYVD